MIVHECVSGSKTERILRYVSEIDAATSGVQSIVNSAHFVDGTEPDRMHIEGLDDMSESCVKSTNTLQSVAKTIGEDTMLKSPSWKSRQGSASGSRSISIPSKDLKAFGNGPIDSVVGLEEDLAGDGKTSGGSYSKKRRLRSPYLMSLSLSNGQQQLFSTLLSQELKKHKESMCEDEYVPSRIGHRSKSSLCKGCLRRPRSRTRSGRKGAISVCSTHLDPLFLDSRVEREEERPVNIRVVMSDTDSSLSSGSGAIHTSMNGIPTPMSPSAAGYGSGVPREHVETVTHLSPLFSSHIKPQGIIGKPSLDYHRGRDKRKFKQLKEDYESKVEKQRMDDVVRKKVGLIENRLQMRKKMQEKSRKREEEELQRGELYYIEKQRRKEEEEERKKQPPIPNYTALNTLSRELYCFEKQDYESKVEKQRMDDVVRKKVGLIENRLQMRKKMQEKSRKREEEELQRGELYYIEKQRRKEEEEERKKQPPIPNYTALNTLSRELYCFEKRLRGKE
ncbi:hypothetical protein ADUPG1_011282 [Aduncisulcus paluster]|uniref:Uncharacterized protein n=1 Tax=Aduncisulcus paluster TaxID=2918883 RepID=A0ABQ5JV16_9EUKA|nr:hypothetical protein ADUPG1_011282 [Aduncisulcus paluster]